MDINGGPGGRDHDLVVFGATGFVGRLVAAHLAEHAPPDLRIALGGRSEEKLAKVRDGLGGRAADWPLVVADSGDEAALGAMARDARVVVSTVGPYARHGLPLVLACAAAGTDYADLTGEVTFVRRSIDTSHETARRTGARIVHACGFDSVPSDLAALLLAERARADGNGPLLGTRLALVEARGGVSGGTVDSMRAQLDAAGRDPELAGLMRDPYALSPDRAAEPVVDQRGLRRPERDRETDQWVAPFVMAPFNTRIVRRSNALSGWSYGPEFAYSEVVSCGRGPLGPIRAAALTGGTAALVAGLRLPPTRTLADRLLPKPGTGPDERTRQRGRFRTVTRAVTPSGARYDAQVAAQGDPGYAATSVMIGESALSLALDGRGHRQGDGGVLTPATALGDALVARLRDAGFDLGVERVG